MILVFGSINTDLLFTVDTSPVPGQTRLAKTLLIEPGGKGANQALAARRAGANVMMVGAVGRDALADLALTNLRKDGVDLARVVIVEAPTGCASIITDQSGDNSIIVAPGANMLARASQIDEHTLARADMLLLQGESDAREVETLIERAADADVPAILNLAPPLALSERALRNVRVLVVNEDEAAETAARLGCDPTAKGLHLYLGVDAVRTLGRGGCEAATLDGLFHIPAVKIAPVDTTAAGDCFVGVLAASLARGEPLPLAMRAANIAASQACLARGSQSSLPWTKA